MVQEANGGGSAASKPFTMPSRLSELFREFSNSPKAPRLEAFLKEASAWVAGTAHQDKARAAILRLFESNSLWNGKGFAMPDGNTLGGLAVMRLNDSTFGAPPPAAKPAPKPAPAPATAPAGTTTSVTESGASGGVTPSPSPPTQPAAPGPSPTPAPSGTVAGGGGGGGSAGAATPPVSAAASAAAGDGRPVQIPAPDEAQLWLVDGGTYLLAWQIPGTSTTLFYNVDNPQTLDAIFQGNVTVDREITTDGSTDPATWLERQGQGFFGGAVSEIQNTDDNPWSGAAAKWKDKSRFVPWLNDPEVLAWLAEGMIEQDGRVLTPQAAREAGFSFAEGKSGEELTRELEIYNMSEGQIATERSMFRTKVEDTFRAYGVTIDDQSRPAVEAAIDRVWRGEWDNDEMSNEVRLFADPTMRERSQLNEVEGLGEIVSKSADIEAVRKDVRQWVGPAVASLLSDDWYESWANTRRNDPNGQVAFDEALLGLRIAHFGEYGDNPGLRYDDIASPVKGAAYRAWGEQVDESDPYFLSLLKMNDLSKVDQSLRKEGMKRGNKMVEQSAAEGLRQAFGSGVNRPIYN